MCVVGLDVWLGIAEQRESSMPVRKYTQRVTGAAVTISQREWSRISKLWDPNRILMQLISAAGRIG